MMSEQGSFSPHQNFAENLMALCMRHGSIASVCRGINMNRQQFNKYLSGSALPSPATMEKICSFFDVDPEAMFHDPRGFRGNRPEPRPDPMDILSQVPSAVLLGMTQSLSTMRETSLRTGCYLFYYPWPRNPTMCARSAMIVTRRDGYTLFTRFTKFRVLGERQNYYLRGRHDGVVLEADGAKFLLAINKKGFGELSLVTFGVEDVLNSDFLSGLALVMGPSANPMALRAILQYRGSHDILRKTISEAGILPLSDPSIDDQVREAISDVPQITSPHLPTYKLVDRLPR
ncbi:helix-turn-helix domain-containing protein [Aestuariivirga sp.]|uniref:helix-turn-helix domain-containing protein n=1 Tax=Aestuariivirga sp. TaxID=2650926 RepID=UPI003593DDE4